MSLVGVIMVGGLICHVLPVAPINLDLAGIDTGIKCKIAITMYFVLITFLFLNENKQYIHMVVFFLSHCAKECPWYKYESNLHCYDKTCPRDYTVAESGMFHHILEEESVS